MTAKAKNMVLIGLYIILFLFGINVLRGFFGKTKSPIINNEILYNEYEFPDRYYVWVSNDRKDEEWLQKYELQDNKKVRIESGSKIIVLRKEGLSYFSTDTGGNIVDIAFSYKLKKGFISKVKNNRINWYNGFNEKGISYVAEHSTINRVRFTEMFGESVNKITEMKRTANRDVEQGKLTEEQSWLKTKEKVRRAINSHDLIVTNVAYVYLDDGSDRKYQQAYSYKDPDYNESQYIEQSRGYMPDDLKTVFDKILKDEPELDRRLQNLEQRIQNEKIKQIEKADKKQKKKISKKAFDK